jgi:hypothetical protein
MKNSEIKNDDVDLNFSIDGPFILQKEEQEMPSSFEDATKGEISEVLAAFKKRAADEAAAKTKNISTEYWFAVYFASQEQRDSFLNAVKLLEKLEDQYLDGTVLAKKLGISIPKEDIKIPKAFRKPAGIEDLILEL